MTKLTLQQIFDIGIAGIRAQAYRESRVGGGGSCAYRGAGDTKCIVGHVIPDPLYTPEIEGMGVNALLMTDLDMAFLNTTARFLLDIGATEVPLSDDAKAKISAFREMLPEERPTGFMGDFQRLHDSFLDVDGEFFEREAYRFALIYKLVYTPPMTQLQEGAE